MNTQFFDDDTLPLVSIIIPVFDDIKGLKKTMKSITQVVDKCKDIEIIICNDGGDENITQVAKSYAAIEVRLQENKGSYAARNRGIEAASGDVLAFLDADQRVDVSWLDAGTKALEHADYAGGQIVVETGLKPSVWDTYDALTAFPVERYLAESHFAPTANLFIRKDIISKVGAFHEGLRSGGDLEFGRRVFDGGLKQVYAPEAITFHHARNHAQQIKKTKRVSEGMADIAYLIMGKNSIFLLIVKLLVLGKLPFETIWRISRIPFVSRQQEILSEPLFILMTMKKKFFFHWYFICRTVYWITKGGS